MMELKMEPTDDSEFGGDETTSDRHKGLLSKEPEVQMGSQTRSSAGVTAVKVEDRGECDIAVLENQTEPINFQANGDPVLTESQLLNVRRNLNDTAGSAISSNLGTQSQDHRPYQCKFPGCGAKFAHLDDLKVHKHTVQKSFSCDFANCGAVFALSSYLEAHKLVHTNDMPYKCEFSGCGASFALLSKLVLHKQVHPYPLPNECEFAGSVAAIKDFNELKVHKQEKHTPSVPKPPSEKPFKCDFGNCRVAFAHLSALKHHKKTHDLILAGGIPVICEYTDCRRAYASVRALNNHTRVHQKTHIRKHAGKECNCPDFYVCKAAVPYQRKLKVEY